MGPVPKAQRPAERRAPSAQDGGRQTLESRAEGARRAVGEWRELGEAFVFVEVFVDDPRVRRLEEVAVSDFKKIAAAARV